MWSRGSVAVLQLAVFVSGGVVAPVAHLARHRPDHTHGPGGWVTTSEAESPHGSHHDSHSHGHDGARHPAPEPSGPGSQATRRGAAATPHALEAEPLEATHGHGSLAHLGLALLSAPPPLPLPTPRLGGVLEPAPPARTVALFHPGFPRPRPPPAPAFS